MAGCQHLGAARGALLAGKVCMSPPLAAQRPPAPASPLRDLDAGGWAPADDGFASIQQPYLHSEPFNRTLQKQ